MANSDPDRYLDPVKYEAYVSAYLGQGMTEDDARTNLKRREFNLPPGESDAPVVTETIETAVPVEATSQVGLSPGRGTSAEQIMNWAMGDDDSDPAEVGEIMTEEPMREAPGSIEPEKTAVAATTTLPPRPDDDEASPGWGLIQKGVDYVFGDDDAPEIKKETLSTEVAPAIDPKEDVKTTETLVEAPIDQDSDAKQAAITGAKAILQPDPYGERLKVFTDVIDRLEVFKTTLEGDEDTEGSTLFFFGEKENYLDLAGDIKEEIDTYEDNINAIAQEKPGEAISGANKFWAVIAAALGAGAASITGTPNFAMQIINKTIDQHLEKFKADRDFRVKSAERQQLNLITERGKMLQMAQNAADSAAASLKDRRDVETQIATISGIKEDAKRALEKNKNDYSVAVKTLVSKQLEEMQKGLAPNMGTYPGEVGVSMLVGAGRDKIMKQVVDFNQVYSEVKAASEHAARILKEHKAKTITPQIFSKERILLAQRMGQIKVNAAKKLYDFGAALTEIEVKLLESIIATAGVMDIAFGITEEKIRNFMIIMDEKRQALRDAGGFTTLGESTKADINKVKKQSVENLGGSARYATD